MLLLIGAAGILLVDLVVVLACCKASGDADAFASRLEEEGRGEGKGGEDGKH